MSQDPQAESACGRDPADEERHRTVVSRLRARAGRAPTVEEFQKAYRDLGLECPDERELRRRHVVADGAS